MKNAVSMCCRVLTPLLVILVLHCARGTPRAVGTPIHVFLFAGQSNMAGVDSLVPDPPGFVSTPADKATLFTAAPVIGGARSSEYTPWGEMKGHRGSSPRYRDKLIHGPEVGFARRLYEAGVRNIAIVKTWANFSRDASGWPWSEDGEYFKAWMTFVGERFAELRERGFEPTVRGLLWHQGIDDAIHGTLADRYEANLTALIIALRRKIGSADTPFILARSVASPIAHRLTGLGPNAPMSIVRRAQLTVAETMPRVGWISVDDLPNIAQHHFSAETQLVIGRRFADECLDKFVER